MRDSLRDRRDGAEQAEPPYFTSESANSNKKTLTLSEGKFLMHISLKITSIGSPGGVGNFKNFIYKHFIKFQSI